MTRTSGLRRRLSAACDRLRRLGRRDHAREITGRWWHWRRRGADRQARRRRQAEGRRRREQARRDRRLLREGLAELRPAPLTQVPSPAPRLTWEDARREFERLYLQDLRAWSRSG